MFASLLIANRGEIACRIMATARRLGVRTIAVHSDADADALHVRLADQAVRIGPPPARESYLDGAAIIAAALGAGAEAIHPGYGFLAESAEFAAACAAAGLMFVGPSPHAMRVMGSKAAARQCMIEAGVPVTPGYHGACQAPDFLAGQADALGYPVLIKACAGGGGRGMRLVAQASEFAAALAACRREALAAFGADQVLIERCVPAPRHIEVQIVGDSQGRVVHLYDRDCSAQRRFQKVVEEAPAPGLSAALRAAMAAAAVTAAQAVGYVGAGTVEFLLGADGQFHFMEMNTRLQVEHPVTEAITGLDLVEWQLRVASGDPLPLTQPEIPCRGHAIEARLCAEDPVRGFLPAIGTLQRFRLAPDLPAVRVDSGVEEGSVLSPHYDSLLAKLIVWDTDRSAACQRLARALAASQVVGLSSNRLFLERLVRLPAFLAGSFDTGLIDAHLDALCAPPSAPAPFLILLAALAELAAERAAGADRTCGGAAAAGPWQMPDGFRVNLVAERQLCFRTLSPAAPGFTVQARSTDSGWLLALGERAVLARAERVAGGRIRYVLGDQSGYLDWMALGQTRLLCTAGLQLELQRTDRQPWTALPQAALGGLCAPMPGRIIALQVTVGQQVAAGAPLLVLEAMKMEHTLKAPVAGSVAAWLCTLGEQVDEGRELIEFLPLAV